MQEENKKISSKNSTPENNLNTKPVSDQGVKIIEEETSVENTHNDVLDNTETEIMENNINTEVDNSISDLNAELSKLSNKSKNDIFVKEDTKSLKSEKSLDRVVIAREDDSLKANLDENHRSSLTDFTEQNPSIKTHKPISNIKESSQLELQKELNSNSLLDEKIVTQKTETNKINPEIETLHENIEQNLSSEHLKTIPNKGKQPKKITEEISVEIDKEIELKTQEKSIKERMVKEIKKESPIAIRTYRDDLARVIKKNKISLTEAIIAEETKKDKKLLKKFSQIKNITKNTQKKIILTSLSAFLILSGITFVFFVYYYKDTPVIKVENVEVKTFIYSEYQREIFLEKLNNIKLTKLIQTELDNTNLPIGSLLHLYLTTRIEKDDGVVGKSIVNTSELFSSLGSRVSETFLRFIEPDFMYGYYSSAENYPFIILKTRSFDNSFPEMLNWEKNLIEDLRPIFVENNPAISQSELRTEDFNFKDIVIKNKDTRAILNNSGEIIFIYSFINKNTIIITTSKTALQEIFDRLTISYRER